MVSITRLSGGLTPANGADPRTFPAIWNTTADTIEGLDLNDLADVTAPSPTTGQILEWNGTAWVNGQVDAAGIASDAVTTAKILNANVTRAKLANGLAAFTARDVITTTGASTWTVPALGNNNWVRVTVIGGGGGGGGAGGTDVAGGNGGTTTFSAGSNPSAAGGVGGARGSSNVVGVSAGAGLVSANIGRGGHRESAGKYGKDGLGGAITVAYIDLTGISTVSVTVGAGGTAGTGDTAGGAGGAGSIIVEYVAA
jgi:hypothetical protein